MSERNLRIVTHGQITTGFDQSLVESNLAQLCKFSPEKVTRVLSGERTILKSGLDRKMAKRYLSALAATGLVCTLESIPASTSDASNLAGPSAPKSPQSVSVKHRGSSTTTGEKRNFSLWKYALSLVIVIVFFAVGAFAVYKIARGFSPDHWAAETGFEYVEPPDQPPVMSRKVQLTEAEIEQIFDLLESQQFAALNAQLEKIQDAFERDPTLEFKIIQTFATFNDPYLPRRALYDEWVAQFPNHYAPYLARAEYFEVMGWESRGGKWARETSEEQFAGMHKYFDLAIADLDSALKLNPCLLPAHILMINIYKAQGPKTQLNLQIKRAQKLFPASYQLYKGILKAKLPRWGGSYAEMTRYAQQANEHVTENPDMPLLYSKVYMDMAWYADREKQYQEAIDLYNQALSYGVYAGLLEERGQAYEKIDDLESAFSDYKRAIEVNPDYSAPYRGLANLYFKRGDFYTSLETIEKAQSIYGKRYRFIHCWYGSKIQYLMSNKIGPVNDFIASANLYEAAERAKPYPAKPLNAIASQFRFKSPRGTTPYGLAWYQGSLYLSSYRDAPGIYQLDPTDGRVINVGVPNIVYKNQYGGLGADSQRLYHLEAYYDRELHELNAETLESTNKTCLYTSRFHLSDFALHNQHIYAIGYHLWSDLRDYRLLKFSPEGVLRESFEITPVKGKFISPGMASDGTWLWVSMKDVLYKMDPATGDVVDGFFLPGQMNCLAWDGSRLWGATLDGDIFTMTTKP